MLIKNTSMCIIVALLLLSITVMFPPSSVAGADTTYVSVINPVDGTAYFNYSNVEPPPTEAGYGLGYVIVNVTVTDVSDLAGYLINLTWDPSLLEIAKTTDIYLPSGHILEDLDPIWMPPNINNTVGYLCAVCACGPGAAGATFTGSGTVSQVKFNVTKGPPGLGEVFSCDIAFGLAGTFPTVLKDSDKQPIEFTPEDGYYQYGAPADNTPPVIKTPTRVPEGDVEPYQDVTVSVNVTDEVSGVKNVTLRYTTDNGTTWTDIPTSLNETSGFYETTIPGQPADTWVKYEIVAYDNAGNNATKDGTEPYFSYLVIPEFTSTIILQLLMIATLIAFALMRHKHPKKKIQRQ